MGVQAIARELGLVPSTCLYVLRALVADVAFDAAAFDALVRRHYRTAYVVAFGVLVNAHDAEEVCQESFVKALERLDDCRDPDRFAPWLMTIVRHRALSYRSYRKVRETSELMPEIAEARDSPFRDVAQAELGDRLTAALATLELTRPPCGFTVQARLV